MRWEIGDVIDKRFRLDKLIGHGGMADVYLATDIKDGYQYALKFIREDLLEEPDLIQRFKDEAETLRDLQHPNIVRFYEFVSNADYAYIVMDYVDGPSLANLLRTKHKQEKTLLHPAEVLHILAQVTRGLERVHQSGWVHRDIKPANVLIRDSDQVAFISDLGIAKDLHAALLTRFAPGTPPYMAPEQHMGWPVSPAVDIYSLAIVAFEMFTGQRPFRGEKSATEDPSSRVISATRAQRLLEQHLYEPPPLASQVNPNLSPGVDAVLNKAMAKNPEHRYQSSLVFAQNLHEQLKPAIPETLHDFQALGRAQQPSVPATPPPNGNGKPRMRAARLAWFGYGATVLLAVLGFLFLGLGILQMASSPGPTMSAVEDISPTPPATTSTASPGTPQATTASAAAATPEHSPTLSDHATTSSLTESPGGSQVAADITLTTGTNAIPTTPATPVDPTPPASTFTPTATATSTTAPKTTPIISPTSTRITSETPGLTDTSSPTENVGLPIVTPTATSTATATPTIPPTSTRILSETPLPTDMPSSTDTLAPTGVVMQPSMSSTASQTSSATSINTPSLTPSPTSTATNTASPTLSPTNMPTPTSAIFPSAPEWWGTSYTLYEDDFDPPEMSIWLPQQGSGRSWQPGLDALRIRPTGENIPAEFLMSFMPENMLRYSAWLRLESNRPADSRAGLVLRYQSQSAQNYYVFGVELQEQQWFFEHYREDGLEKLRRPVANGPLPETEDGFDYLTDEIQLTVLADGNIYYLGVNQEDVATVDVSTDGLSPEGNLGLIVDNRRTANIGYLFTQVRVELLGLSETPTPVGPAGTTSTTSDLACTTVVQHLNNLSTTLLDPNNINCASYVNAFNVLLADYTSYPSLFNVLNAGDGVKNRCYELGLPTNFVLDDNARQSYYEIMPAIQAATGQVCQ